MYTVYTLSNDCDGLFYVGLTKDRLAHRLVNHHYESRHKTKSANHTKNEIMLRCKREGRIIQIEALERHADKREAIKNETYWICQLSTWGFVLVNKVQTNATKMNKYFMMPYPPGWKPPIKRSKRNPNEPKVKRVSFKKLMQIKHGIVELA